MSALDAPIIGAAITGLAPGSPLAGEGLAFGRAGERHDVDWRLLVAIAYAETELGRTGNAEAIRNPFGLGPGIRFNSWADSIDRAAELIREYRDDHGLTTVAQVGSRWAPQGASNDPSNLNSNWTRNVTATLVRLGGDPNDLTGVGGSTLDGFRSIPGDARSAAGDAASAVTEPAAALADLAARLTDPAWWIRAGMVVSGVLAIGLGVYLTGRSVTGEPAP